MKNPQQIEDFFFNELQIIWEQLTNRLINITKQLKQEEVIQLVAETDFFAELNTLGLDSLVFQTQVEYDDIVNELNKLAKEQGVKGLTGQSATDLEMLMNVEFDELLGSMREKANAFKLQVLRNLIAGVSPGEIVNQIRFWSAEGLADYRSLVALDSAIAQFRTLTTAKIYEDEPDEKFILVGPLDAKTRCSCKGVLEGQPKEGWTRKQIDEGAATKLAFENCKELGKIFSTYNYQQAKNKPNLIQYTFVGRGGYNCRHEFVSKKIMDIVNAD